MKIINKLNEMALSRSDAIDRCMNLGNQFINHFHKAVLDTIEESFSHHCSEMQNWFNMVKDIVLKHNGKRIKSDDLINWFFTAGSSVELKIEEKYQEIYEELYLRLLGNRNSSNVENILKEIIKREQ